MEITPVDVGGEGGEGGGDTVENPDIPQKAPLQVSPDSEGMDPSREKSQGADKFDCLPVLG